MITQKFQQPLLQSLVWHDNSEINQSNMLIWCSRNIIILIIINLENSRDA